MAKKTATVAYPSVETVLASIEAADAKMHTGLVQAKATMVADLIAAIRGKVAPLTAETWKSTWSDPVKAMLTAAKNADGSNRYNSAGTISVTLSWMRNVFLALSNVPDGANKHALLPTAGEVSFQAYAQGVRARLALPQFKILEEVKDRGPKPSRKDQVKALQAQVKAAEAKLAAATAKVTDNASAQAAQQTTATTVNAALAAAPPVDILCGALNAMCPNHKVSRSDAEMILHALRKDFDGALNMLRFVAAKEPAKA